MHRWRGLTLLEVLVVVGIVAMLIAVLLPSLVAARQQAKRMACASHLRAVGNALNYYKTQLGRYPTVGDRAPHKIYGTPTRPSDPPHYRSTLALTAIADVAEALYYSCLSDPWAMYCPSSFEDIHAPKPYSRVAWRDHPVPTWRTGDISYIYLVGLDYRRKESTFPDRKGHPTFNPATEAPERSVNRANPRAILIGDSTVELVPPSRNIPGSNHGREGGWFYYTSGDCQWWSWPRLTAHPTSVYNWYWPRISPPRARTPEGQSGPHFTPGPQSGSSQAER